MHSYDMLSKELLLKGFFSLIFSATAQQNIITNNRISHININNKAQQSKPDLNLHEEPFMEDANTSRSIN